MALPAVYPLGMRHPDLFGRRRPDMAGKAVLAHKQLVRNNQWRAFHGSLFGFRCRSPRKGTLLKELIGIGGYVALVTVNQLRVWRNGRKGLEPFYIPTILVALQTVFATYADA